MKAINLAVLFLTTLCGLAVSKPSYGNDIFTLTLFGDKHPDVDHSSNSLSRRHDCASVSLYGKDNQSTEVTVQATSSRSGEHVPVEITFTTFSTPCANIANPAHTISCSYLEPPRFNEVSMMTITAFATKTIQNIKFNINPEETCSKLGSPCFNQLAKTNYTSRWVFTADSTNVYVFRTIAEIIDASNTDARVTITMKKEMETSHGYLSAADFPSYVFYRRMIFVYAILGIIWFMVMAHSIRCRNLTQMQMSILYVIIIGFIEKTIFVLAYCLLNYGVNSSWLIGIAGLVSSLKRAVSRALLVNEVVCYRLAYATDFIFPPPSPFKGWILEREPSTREQGMAYYRAIHTLFLTYLGLGVIDLYLSIRMDTPYTERTWIISQCLFVLLELFTFYFIAGYVVDTIRILRLKQNSIKLNHYNHFVYTIIAAFLASLGIFIWICFKFNFPEDDCLTDWQDVWLRDCAWHILFCITLIVIMVLGRPGLNHIRSAVRASFNEELQEITALQKMRGDKDGPIMFLNYDTDVRLRQFGLIVLQLII